MFFSYPIVLQPTYALKKAELDEQQLRVHLAGRREGFWAWVAGLFGADPHCELTMDATGFNLKRGSFTGTETVYTPIRQIAAAVIQTNKPVERLLISMILFVLGLALLPTPAIVVGIVLACLALIFLLLFLFGKRRLVLGVVLTGGVGESVRLNVNRLDLRNVELGYAIMEAIMSEGKRLPPEPTVEEAGDDDASAIGGHDDAGPLTARSRVAPVAEKSPLPTTAVCPFCRQTIPIPPEARGRRVRCSACQEIFRVPV